MTDKEESLTQHLEALRKALIRSFACIAILLPFAFWVSPKVLDFSIKVLLGDSGIHLNYFSPLEVFILQMKIALFIALIVSFPYIAKNIWDFIMPALHSKEKKFIKSIVFFSSLLFCFGIAFCFFIILPIIIRFGMSFASPQMQPVFGVSNIITLSLSLSIVFGIMFQFPLITYALIKSNIISYESVSSKRSYIIIGILIMATLLTPPDVLSQILLFLPTYMLFELGLLFARKNNRR
ncbi:MAG: twin-arginine translocase subunit TatC [Endomicrobia bacterium]|nr:twin-arginine translocase subunit TatC [Endomicrobiia bacterium]MCL2799549.1 twin-arginine translocase subunit TatC [Endomicrobiia bacterium]